MEPSQPNSEPNVSPEETRETTLNEQPKRKSNIVGAAVIGLASALAAIIVICVSWELFGPAEEKAPIIHFSSIPDTETITKEAYQSGDQVDLLVHVTTYEAESGGGDDVYHTIILTPISESEQVEVFRIGGLNDPAVECVDNELQSGDIARLQGRVRNLVSENGVIMSCNDPETSLVKVEDMSTESVSLLQEYNDNEYGISFRYPDTFRETSDTYALFTLEDDTDIGATFIKLYVAQDTSEEIAEIPGGRWVPVGDTQGYLYFYREGMGYSGVFLWQTDTYSASLHYDVIGTSQSEQEIEERFMLILKTIQLHGQTEVSNSMNRTTSCDTSKISFDIENVRTDFTSIDYEFCVPREEKYTAEVARIDPTAKCYEGSAGRIGCSDEQVLCVGGAVNAHDVICNLSLLKYVERIDQTFWE